MRTKRLLWHNRLGVKCIVFQESNFNLFLDVHLDLENKIAEFLGLEETVLYSYGFSTVSSAIGAYCKRSDYIFWLVFFFLIFTQIYN